MPYAYDPDAAIIIDFPDDTRTIDTGSLILTDEEFLLVHRCRRAANVGTTRRVIGQLVTRPGGGGATYTWEDEPRCLFREDTDQQLSYEIEAEALSLYGLANFHPGCALDDYALAFLNGSVTDLAFRFTGGIWIYMDPEQDIPAGDLTQIKFRCVREFATLNATDTEPETGPTNYTLLPEQLPAPVRDATRTLSLEDVFTAAANISGDFTVTFYDGDPLAAGTAATEALVCAAWGEVSAVTYLAEIRNGALLTWAADPAARTLTHVLIKRGATVLAAPALSSPVSVPAGYGIRAPERALGLSIRWDLEGTMPADYLTWPGIIILQALAGGTPIPATGSVVIECYDNDPDDPLTPGTLIDEFAVPRNGITWDITTLTAANLTTLTGTDLAPGGGWSTIYVAARLADLTGTRWLKHLASAPITTTVGNAITVPIGEATVTLP